MYTYKAKVSNVVDGDTIDVVIDVGFNITCTERLRLLGINCPEIRGYGSSPEGAKAKEYTRARLFNKDITIETEKDDAFGRYLANVFIDGVNFNQELMDKGYAVEYKRK